VSTFIQTYFGQIVSQDLPLLLFWVELRMFSLGSSTANMKNKEIYNSVPSAFTYHPSLCNYRFLVSYLCSLPLQTRKLWVVEIKPILEAQGWIQGGDWGLAICNPKIAQACSQRVFKNWKELCLLNSSNWYWYERKQKILEKLKLPWILQWMTTMGWKQ